MQGNSNRLTKYFAGIAEHVFEAQLGVVDPPLVDYLTDLLIRFIRHDSLAKIRTATGRPATEVVEMLAEAEHRQGLARRDVHRHIGDVTLFWVGVYPEAVQRMRGPERKDYFLDYCSHGKRAYHIAAEIDTDRQEDAPAEILHRLSEQFELCAYGLGEIRQEWSRRDDDEQNRMLWID